MNFRPVIFILKGHKKTGLIQPRSPLYLKLFCQSFQSFHNGEDEYR